MADRIQLRRDMAVVWALANPVLGQGEPGFELDTGKLKVGDGSTAWNSLGYMMENLADKTYEHTQSAPADVWAVTHNLNKFPSVTVIDSGGSEVEGDIAYDSLNQITITFSAPMGGKAHLN